MEWWSLKFHEKFLNILFNLEPKKSLFAQARQQKQQLTPPTTSKTPNESIENKILFDEIHHKIVGVQNVNQSLTDIIMGDIVEKKVQQPKHSCHTEIREAAAFPKIPKMSIKSCANKPVKGKSVFAQIMEEKSKQKPEELMECDEPEPAGKRPDLSALYGEKSVIVEDSQTAVDVHKENISLLCQMKEEEILAERKRLLESIGK